MLPRLGRLPSLLLGLLFAPSATASVVTVVHSHPTPVIDGATAASFGISGGFETGNALKLNGTYHLFYGERAPPTTYPWKMGWTTQIGHWTSPDGLACELHPIPPWPGPTHRWCGRGPREPAGDGDPGGDVVDDAMVRHRRAPLEDLLLQRDRRHHTHRRGLQRGLRFALAA